MEITGITDAGMGGVKRVMFDYEYENVPGTVRKCLGIKNKYQGTAGLKLYDHGWRVEGIGFAF
jgi:hypothetical protein